MITFLIIGIVLILAVALAILVWSNGKNKRTDQSQTNSAVASAGETKIGRAAGPD